MSREQIFELDPVSEIEMWMACLTNYFKYYALSFAARGRIVTLEKNFYEELRVASWMLDKIHELATRVVLAELADVKEVHWDEVSARGTLPEEFIQHRHHTAAAARVISLLETANDFRIVFNEKLQTGVIPFAFFKSVGRLLNREFVAFRRNRALPKVRKKHKSRAWLNFLYRDVLMAMSSLEMRLETMALFVRAHRILSIIRYIKVGLRGQFNARVYLVLFSHLYAEGKNFARKLEQWASRWETQLPVCSEVSTSLQFALRLETKRVFKQELLGIEHETRVDALYIRLETSAGLLWNCYQNVFISMARSFNLKFNEYDIFIDLIARQEESVRLESDLCTIRELVRRMESGHSGADVEALRKLLRIFNENSLRYLMFKDWGPFEGFIDQVNITPDNQLAPVLHRFLIFLDTLIAAVEKRAVLLALDEPHDDRAAGQRG